MDSQEKRQKEAAIAIILAVGDAIKEAGEIPSGHLYAMLMGQMQLSSYEYIIDTLKRSGVVQETNYVLKWIGPKAMCACGRGPVLQGNGTPDCCQKCYEENKS